MDPRRHTTASIAAALLSATLFLVLTPTGARGAGASVHLKAPAEASVGTEIAVSHSGSTAPVDFISIDKDGARDREYGTYAYVKSGNPVKLRVPDLPGTYRIRYHRQTTYEVAASVALTVRDVTATLEAPEQVDAGASFEVKFSGPETTGDFIGIDKVGAADRDYGPYVYTKRGNPAEMRAPDQAGDYEIRYHLGQSYRVIASKPLAVGKTAASLDAPSTVPAGSEIEIHWTGPNHPTDFVSIDTHGAAERDYGPYAYTKDGSPLTIRVPEVAGDYRIRYRTGQTYAIVTERPLTVAAVDASLQGPAEVEARTKFDVGWSGPDNPEDYVALAAGDAPARETLSYAYTRRGSPARLEAPKEAGTYELRYITGRTHQVLARGTIEVTPGMTPGRLRVSAADGKAAETGAVELILDASGSMLQRLDGKRRIDLAKDALVELTRDVLPDDTPFALRVFGHRQPNACQTDLEIPLAPLDRGAAVATIRAVEAKNLAKTPIGESLLRVQQDLAGVEGAAIVVLVTDGEETCDGDPAAAIEALRGAGFDVRVNIVGFAIDELALREEFATWARLGGGAYFDAGDGDGLRGAIRASLRLPYTVRRDASIVATGVVGGDAIELAPGKYQVELGSNPPRPLGDVTITADAEALLEVR